MSTSRTWFQKNANQNMTANLSKLPTLAMTGHSAGANPNNTNKDKNGNNAFVVGKTVVGGEEVIG